MSTTEDFENAPIGATATSPNGNTALKTERRTFEWAIYDSRAGYCDFLRSDEMGGYTLNPTPPTTAREALALAWELAHPVEEGQVIPAGALCLAQFDDGYQSYETAGEVITSETLPDIRTLDPLPDPEPDWLDAPAVMARLGNWFSYADPQVFTRKGTHWTREAGVYHWTELIDVTPLYPKENS